jgi:hypothetical protein
MVIAERAGLADVAGDDAFVSYRAWASRFGRAELRDVSRTFGGGEPIGPGGTAIIFGAAMQFALSRYLADLAALDGDDGKILQSARLADMARQGLLTAREIIAREAVARRDQRKRAKDAAEQAAFMKRLLAPCEQAEASQRK